MHRVQKYLPATPLEQFCIYRGGFTSDEIDQIDFIVPHQNFEKGSIGNKLINNAKTDLTVRDADIIWINKDQNSAPHFDILGRVISKVNHDHFLLDIDGIESLQYTKYDKDQHYTWHMDYEYGFREWVRKISVSVMMSDPSEYEGGELEICINGNIDKPIKLKPEKGDIVFFASWMPHRVAPIISGTRKTLVTWVMGKRES